MAHDKELGVLIVRSALLRAGLEREFSLDDRILDVLEAQKLRRLFLVTLAQAASEHNVTIAIDRIRIPTNVTFADIARYLSALPGDPMTKPPWPKPKRGAFSYLDPAIDNPIGRDDDDDDAA